MNIREIFHFNNFIQKIALDKNENDSFVHPKEKLFIEEKKDDEKFQINEWNQEYELIYLSYVLER